MIFNKLEDERMEEKANLMSDCSVGKEQKCPALCGVEQHHIMRSITAPFHVLLQQ